MPSYVSYHHTKLGSSLFASLNSEIQNSTRNLPPLVAGVHIIQLKTLSRLQHNSLLSWSTFIPIAKRHYMKNSLCLKLYWDIAVAHKGKGRPHGSHGLHKFIWIEVNKFIICQVYHSQLYWTLCNMLRLIHSVNSHLRLKGCRQNRHMAETKISERKRFEEVVHNETNVPQAGTGQCFQKHKRPGQHRWPRVPSD